MVEGEVASFLIALLKYPRPILYWSRDCLKWDPRVRSPGSGHWKRRFIWDGERVVDTRFFSKCVFLLCYKASDSIGEASRRAGMRACQLGSLSQSAGSGTWARETGIQTPGTGEKRPGPVRSGQSANPGIEPRSSRRDRVAFFSSLFDTLIFPSSDA